jgi:hypothetical protein
MKLGAIALAGLGSFFASTPAQATEIDSIWSTSAAWTPANQPSYTAAGGTLFTDESIAAGHNTLALNTDATLLLGAVTQGGGIYANSYLYTGGSVPTFTLSTSNILSGAKSISFTIDAAVGVFTSSSLTFSLGGSLASFTAVDTGVKAAGFELFDYTWNWDVSSVSPYSNISISWATPAVHTAYTEVALAQSTQVAAVPEPQSGLFLLASLAFFCRLRWRKPAPAPVRDSAFA